MVVTAFAVVILVELLYLSTNSGGGVRNDHCIFLELPLKCYTNQFFLCLNIKQINKKKNVGL